MNTSPQSSKSSKDDNLMAALSYVFVLCFVPLLLSRGSAFVKFHAKQGLVLFIVEVAVMILASILVFIPVFGWLANFVMYLVVIVLSILGFFNALQGKQWEMPWFGGYAKRLKI